MRTMISVVQGTTRKGGFMPDIRSDGSGIKRTFVETKKKKSAKILPFNDVGENDLKKIAEIGKVVENLMGHTGWQVVEQYIDSRNSSETLIQAKAKGTDTLNDLMAEIIGFRNLKAWLVQQIQNGIQAEEVLEIRRNLKEDELQRKQNREVKPRK